MAGEFESEFDLSMMIALVPNHVLKKKDRVVVVEFHLAAGEHFAFYGVAHGIGAVAKHAGDVVRIRFGGPFFFGQWTLEFGRVFGKEDQPAVVHMREQLGEPRTVGVGSDCKGIGGQRAEEVDEDGVVAVPGVEEGFEKLVWHVDFSRWKTDLGFYRGPTWF